MAPVFNFSGKGSGMKGISAQYDGDIEKVEKQAADMESLTWIRSLSTRQGNKRPSQEVRNSIFRKIPKLSTADRFALSKEAVEELELIETMEFDIFKFRDMTDNQEVVVITSYLMEKHSLFTSQKIDYGIYMNFMKAVQAGYVDIPYHNQTHGVDVCQSAYYFTMSCGLSEKLSMQDIDLTALIIATSIHDYEHFGFNNAFLTETRHKWAITYNDQSVCENHHVAAAFELMQDKSKNIFALLDKEEFKQMRKRIVSMVLGTDMAKHMEHTNKLDSMAETFDKSDHSEDDQIFLLSMAVHLSDLSNPTKDWYVSKRWSILLYEEFFAQGDKEMEVGLPRGNLTDRSTVNIAKGQVGFINFVILPVYESWVKLLPKAQKNLDGAKENKRRWENLVDSYDLMLTKGYDMEALKRENEEEKISMKKLPSLDYDQSQEGGNLIPPKERMIEETE